jgi:hypothetical protein
VRESIPDATSLTRRGTAPGADASTREMRSASRKHQARAKAARGSPRL